MVAVPLLDPGPKTLSTPKSLAALRGASRIGFIVGIEGERAGDKGEWPVLTLAERLDEVVAAVEGVSLGVSGRDLPIPISVIEVRRRGSDAER
jgi:hypothetical protein